MQLWGTTVISLIYCLLGIDLPNPYLVGLIVPGTHASLKVVHRLRHAYLNILPRPIRTTLLKTSLCKNSEGENQQ